MNILFLFTIKIKIMLQKNQTIGQIVIVGGGPVGNFSAVLAAMLGVKCTVYEKRDGYTRQINLKIEKDFFKGVFSVMGRISRKNRLFFKNLNDTINQKNGKILLKDLQSTLKQQAQNLGVVYQVGKEIKTFQQVSDLHQHNFPIILDCAGRRSLLRENEFGNDEKNMKIYNLHYALHVNFKAVVTHKFDHRLLYPVLKYSENLKLGEIIVSKKKQKQQTKYSHVTVPLFISDQLSDIIDEKYPDINRAPLKPFSLKSKQSIMVKQVQQVIYSLFCALVMEEWDIDWSSVVLKKINITCGYAIRRSYDRYICMGDSAAHFAYFKSLNFGLKHTFQFFKILASYPNLKHQLGPLDQKMVVNRCWKKNPYLWPINAKQGPSACQYYITTSQFKILSPFIYDIRSDTVRIINILPHVSKQKIQEIFQKNRKQELQNNWVVYLQKFEKIRKFDIDNQIFSNRSKKTGSEVVSYFIWLNSMSPIKVSQTLSLITNGYFLQRKDFDYFCKILRQFKDSLDSWDNFTEVVSKRIATISDEKQDKLPQQYKKTCKSINKYCSSKSLTQKQFCDQILKYQPDKRLKKNKNLTLVFKALQIMALIILKQSQKQENDKMKQMQEPNIMKQQIEI